MACTYIRCYLYLMLILSPEKMGPPSSCQPTGSVAPPAVPRSRESWVVAGAGRASLASVSPPRARRSRRILRSQKTYPTGFEGGRKTCWRPAVRCVGIKTTLLLLPIWAVADSEDCLQSEGIQCDAVTNPLDRTPLERSAVRTFAPDCCKLSAPLSVRLPLHSLAAGCRGSSAGAS